MTNTVTNTLVTELVDPKLRAIAMRVVRTVELGIDKVAANHQDPSRFPLPTEARTLEQILAGRFRTLPEATRKAAASRAVARIQAPEAARQARFKDLARVDLTKAVPVAAQAKAIPLPAELKLPPDYLKKFTSVHGQVVDPPLLGTAPQLGRPLGSAVQQTTDNLELRIHSVDCVDETSDLLGGELGDDEISLGGTSVDETGDTKPITASVVSTAFDDGEKRVYSPPWRFTWFNMNEGNVFPKTYFVTMVLAEVDMGGVGDFLTALTNEIEDEVIAALVGVVITLPFGPIIAAVVGFTAVKVFEALQNLWEDDMFKPFTASCTIPSLTARWPGGATDSPEHTVACSAHGGTYQVRYDWRMFAN